MCVGEVRVDIECPAVAAEGIIRLPEALQRNAEVAVRFDEVRLDLQGAAITCGRLFRFP